MKTILALDLGTTTGWCVGTSTCDMRLGSTTLATSAEIKQWGKERLDRRCDPRVDRFDRCLGHLINQPDIVIFEDVQFMAGRKQAHLWSAFRTVVWLRFGRGGHLLECLDTGKLKAHACDGYRNATKEMMVKAACKNPRFAHDNVYTDKFIDMGDLQRHDDNAADAYHLFTWALQNLTRT